MRSPHFCRNTQSIQSLSPSAQTPSCSQTPCIEVLSRSPSPYFHHHSSSLSSQTTMLIEVSKELRVWLTRHGLGGYLHVLDTASHPEAQAVARRVHPDTITNEGDYKEGENMKLRLLLNISWNNISGSIGRPRKPIAHMGGLMSFSEIWPISSWNSSVYMRTRTTCPRRRSASSSRHTKAVSSIRAS